MNKAELVSKIAEASDLTKAAAEKTLNCTLDVIAKALANDENISLIGFGSFSVAQRAARTGRNPQTGKEIKIAEKKVVKFKPGQKLKDSVCVKVKAKGDCGCGCKTTKPMPKKK
jgi:DNA-binding protein HU-beta